MTVKSVSDTLAVNPPAAPTHLTATLSAGPRVSLTWRDNATSETGFVVERPVQRVAARSSQVGTAPAARPDTGERHLRRHHRVRPSTTYQYRVRRRERAPGTVCSEHRDDRHRCRCPAQPVIRPRPRPVPAARADHGHAGLDAATNETGYTVQWSTTSGVHQQSTGRAPSAANATAFTTGNIARNQWFFRVRANNAGRLVGSSDRVSRGGSPVIQLGAD